MANVHTSLASLFTDIANAIRVKTGSTSSIKADDFPTEIGKIEVTKLIELTKTHSFSVSTSASFTQTIPFDFENEILGIKSFNVSFSSGRFGTPISFSIQGKNLIVTGNNNSTSQRLDPTLTITAIGR